MMDEARQGNQRPEALWEGLQPGREKTWPKDMNAWPVDTDRNVGRA